MSTQEAQASDTSSDALEVVRQLGVRARTAARRMAHASTRQKNAALHSIAGSLRRSVERIEAANRGDLEAARAAGRPAAFVDRLVMGPQQVEATAAAVEQVARLTDPVGRRDGLQRLDNGLLAGRQRVPLGVVAMVYESRPNVTVDAAALCLKAGNAVLLRGGKEAASTNAALGQIVGEALAETGLPADAVGIVPADSRETVRALLSLTDLVDLAIPRGGPGLVRFVAETARVPVIKHFQGVCHLYLDHGCELQMAVALALNGKTQRPGVCNALECLLVDARDAERLLPPVARALLDAGVELRACPRARALVPSAREATEDDWGREFLDLVLAVRVVEGLDGALDHVARHGSCHTEVICTPHLESSERWLQEVDASCVVVNASPRFNDGGQLGLGAEIGISTSKLHAYGPMGIESLTTEKWIVVGSGQIRT